MTVGNKDSYDVDDLSDDLKEELKSRLRSIFMNYLGFPLTQEVKQRLITDIHNVVYNFNAQFLVDVDASSVVNKVYLEKEDSTV